jgi:hypothetical protein
MVSGSNRFAANTPSASSVTINVGVLRDAMNVA